MNPIAAKYILLSLSRSTTFFFVTAAGLGASCLDPSSGIGSPFPIAGQYCADPKIYGRKK